MKTAVSIPDPVFRAAEGLASRLGVSRSELYSRALRALISQLDDAAVTEQLNRVHAKAGEEPLDPALAALQARSIARNP